MNSSLFVLLWHAPKHMTAGWGPRNEATWQPYISLVPRSPMYPAFCLRKLGVGLGTNRALTVNALSKIWFPPLSISSALSSGLPSIYICSEHTSLGNCHSSSTLFPAVVSIDRWHCSFVVAKPINCMCGVCSMWRSKGVYAIGLSQQLAASGEGCSVFLRCEQSMNHISLKYRQA